VYRGEVNVGGPGAGRGTVVSSPRLAILGDGDVVRVHAGSVPARLLLLSAQPLNEPYARYGPFVMNTEEEIRETLHELRNGTFIRP
jgi:redox-sensitive bicupin YhaK (pirin superfamily)